MHGELALRVRKGWKIALLLLYLGVHAWTKVLQAQARYNGKSSKGAANFLTALPSANTCLTVQAAAFREALRRWLTIKKPDPGGVCPHCDAELTAEHAKRCTRTGE